MCKRDVRDIKKDVRVINEDVRGVVEFVDFGLG